MPSREEQMSTSGTTVTATVSAMRTSARVSSRSTRPTARRPQGGGVVAAEPRGDRHRARRQGPDHDGDVRQVQQPGRAGPDLPAGRMAPGLPRPVHVRTAAVRQQRVRCALPRLLQLLGRVRPKPRWRTGGIRDVGAERRREAVRVRCTAGWRRAHSVLGRSRQDADGRDRALGPRTYTNQTDIVGPNV